MTRFAVGDCIKVLALGKAGHVRIPHYVRNQVGHITGYCGTNLNPEDLAVGNTSGQVVDLHRVTFSQRQLWPGEVVPKHDVLVIGIYDHWLTPTQEAPHAP